MVEIGGRRTPGKILTDVWTDISWAGIAREGGVILKSGKKPERLAERVLLLATNPGDLVMDAFLGSGTTAAVAHKMGRRWIGIEKGRQAETLCAKRLRAVVAGEDSGGVTASAKWKGGGGFHFLRLGEPVFAGDGKINPSATFPALAAHVWFAETRTPLSLRAREGTFLGSPSGNGLRPAVQRDFEGQAGERGECADPFGFAGLPCGGTEAGVAGRGGCRTRGGW